LTLLVNSESEVTGIEDLRENDDSRVAVQRGTTGHVYAMEHFEPRQVRVLENESSAVLEVLQGRVDAFIYDQMSTYKNWQRHPEQTRAVLEPFQREKWAIGIRQGNDELRSQVNAFLDEAREGGLFEELGDQYLSEQKKAFAEMGIPFYF
jgi:polar amino acid transport system substrate-binding protein